MAWTCNQCSTSVEADDLVCPTCEAPKSVWTMFTERTRTFTISGSKVKYLRGEGYKRVPTGDPTYAEASFVDTKVLYVLEKQAVREAHEAKLLPPSVHVVAVRMFPRKKKDLAVDLTLDYEETEVEDAEFPYEGDPVLSPEGSLDVRFLFVHGEGDLEGVSFDGIDHIVDLTEESGDGFAPSVHASALRKRARKLPAQLLPPWFEVQLRTTTGDPLAGWRYRLELGDDVHEGELGEDGKLHLDDVPPGPGKLTVLPPDELPPDPEAEDAEPSLEDLIWISPDVEPDREGERAPIEDGAFEFSV